MRVLFSTTPAPGHLLPLLPLARALRDRDHTIAFVTAAELAPLVEPHGFEFLAAGPMPDVMFAEVARRHAGEDGMVDSRPELVAEFFAGVRVDMTADAVLDAARSWLPDLIVHENCDFVGPLVATVLGVPTASLSLGPALDAGFVGAMAATVASRYQQRDLPAPADGGVSGDLYLDTCPPALQTPGWTPPAARCTLSPEPHRQPGVEWTAPEFPGREHLPTVFVTMGTTFNDGDMLATWLEGLQDLDVNAIASIGMAADPADVPADRSRASVVQFVPLAQILPGVSAVVTHGGAGTMLGSLSQGLPLVVIPQGADQFINAQLVAEAGVGVAVMPDQSTPETVAKALHTVLTDPAFREASQRVRAQIADMSSPAEVAVRLADLVHSANG